MTMIRVWSGDVNPLTGNLIMVLKHPFLAGARRRHVGEFQEIHATRKTNRPRMTLRIPAEGSSKAPAKTFGKREQARALATGE